jgi:UDP-N-acetylmuramate dehydrogenase
MDLQRNASLKPYNTFGIDARAAVLAPFGSAQELRDLLRLPGIEGLPRLILGGGSNVLFTRDHAVQHCVAQGWGGIENMSLIPGKVGAGPMQNIGAYGVELKDVFVELEALRLADGEVVRFDREACAFGYRESFFKREGRDRYVILNVTVRLRKDPTVNTTYGSIKAALEERGIVQPTISDVSEVVIAIRRSKLPDPSVVGNAGSFFKNPVVRASLAERIKQRTPDLVTFPAHEGHVKLAAGQLIEKAGWKGYREGAVGVHRDQALVLVNHGGATGAAIFDLSTRILASVHERFGVALEREVNII